MTRDPLAPAPSVDASRGGPELVEGPELLRAQRPLGGKLLQRAIPSSGEMLPVVSFGARLPAPHPAPFADCESIMRNEPIDFVATDYHAGDRRADERILPLAQERKIAFMAYFTFDRGRLFKRVGTTPLPDWAAEFDAKTWAQFFVKYSLSHPGVIVARTGTTKAAHMLDTIGGGIGRLPAEPMRKRMAALVDALPAAKGDA